MQSHHCALKRIIFIGFCSAIVFVSTKFSVKFGRHTLTNTLVANRYSVAIPNHQEVSPVFMQMFRSGHTLVI